MEINPTDGSITNSYYYANSQILKQERFDESFEDIPPSSEPVEVCDSWYYTCIQQSGNYEWCHNVYCHMEDIDLGGIPAENNTKAYYYIHDRLGSVRLLVNDIGDVNNSYTYNPFGEAIDYQQTTNNCFMFTGQWYDDEIGQYYLRARMYDPQLMRFTGRDPKFGKLEESLTLHKYLYCINSPTYYVDLNGAEFSLPGLVTQMGIYAGFGALAGFNQGMLQVITEISMGAKLSSADIKSILMQSTLGGAAIGASMPLFNALGTGSLIAAGSKLETVSINGMIAMSLGLGPGMGAIDAWLKDAGMKSPGRLQMESNMKQIGTIVLIDELF